jgi:hypothetical protein
MVLGSGDVQKMKRMGATVIHSNCDPEAAKDKSLPSSSYLVCCKDGDETWYDIVMGLQVPIFDAYHEVFGYNVIQHWKWTDGNVNPKLWMSRNESDKKKK